MMRPNRSMKKAGQAMVVLLLWLMLMGTAAGAELAPTVFLAHPLVQSTVDLLNDKPTVHTGFPVNMAASNPVPEEDSVLVDTAYTTGFFLTFAVVATGYLILYVPAATWGAVKCTMVEDDWNTCWHAYMNRVFH